MKAIGTRTTNPGGVKARYCEASSGADLTVLPWDWELGDTAMHARAARALCDKMGWTGTLIVIGSGFEDGSMVWVFEDSPDRA